MRTYDLQSSPRVYPGQTVEARVVADPGNTGPVTVALRIKVYGRDDKLVKIDGPASGLAPGADRTIAWTIPDLDGQPIQQIGLALSAPGSRVDGVVHLDWLSWHGAPRLRLRRPKEPSAFWRQSWVNNVSFFSKNFASAFRISQDSGVGLIIHGTREWTDYRVSSALATHLGVSAGLAARVQGLRRYYAILLEAGRPPASGQAARRRTDGSGGGGLLLVAGAALPLRARSPRRGDCGLGGRRDAEGDRPDEAVRERRDWPPDRLWRAVDGSG